jgi:hypothetical protein
MLGFIQRHVLVSIGLTLGGLSTVWGLAAQARDLWTANLPPTDFAALGAAVFILSVITLLYRWEQQHHAPAGKQADGARDGAALPWFKSKPVPPPLSKADREAIEASERVDIRFPPAPPLPEHEVTRRLKALEELREVVEAPGKAAHKKVMQSLADHRRLLLDIEDGRAEILRATDALPEVYKQIKRDAAALSEKYGLMFPAIIQNGFKGADEFHDAAARIRQALDFLQVPITRAQVGLLEPWIRDYRAAVGPFDSWLKQCAEEIMLMRGRTLEQMRQ